MLDSVSGWLDWTIIGTYGALMALSGWLLARGAYRDRRHTAPPRRARKD